VGRYLVSVSVPFFSFSHVLFSFFSFSFTLHFSPPILQSLGAAGGFSWAFRTQRLTDARITSYFPLHPFLSYYRSDFLDSRRSIALTFQRSELAVCSLLPSLSLPSFSSDLDRREISFDLLSFNYDFFPLLCST